MNDPEVSLSYKKKTTIFFGFVLWVLFAFTIFLIVTTLWILVQISVNGFPIWTYDEVQQFSTEKKCLKVLAQDKQTVYDMCYIMIK